MYFLKGIRLSEQNKDWMHPAWTNPIFHSLTTKIAKKREELVRGEIEQAIGGACNVEELKGRLRSFSGKDNGEMYYLDGVPLIYFSKWEIVDLGAKIQMIGQYSVLRDGEFKKRVVDIIG